MTMKTNWGVGDWAIGLGQLQKLGEADPAKARWVQALDAITLGRSQIMLIVAADHLTRTAQNRVLYQTGKITIAQMHAMNAAPMPVDQTGGWAKVADDLQEAHGAIVGQVGDAYRAVCHCIRAMYTTHQRTALPAGTPTLQPPGVELPGLTIPWGNKPTGWPDGFAWPPVIPADLPGIGGTGGTGTGTGTGNWWDDLPLPWEGVAGGPTLAIVITVLGIAGIAGATYYGIETQKSGVKVQAERAVAEWQAYTQVEIAKAKINAGQIVKMPEFMTRAAQIERAQSSPIALGLSGLALGGLVTWAALRKPSPARIANPRRAAKPRRPKSRRVTTKRRSVSVGSGQTATVEVRKLKSGFCAYLCGPSKCVPIAIGDVSSWDEAFAAAGRKLRAVRAKRRKVKNPRKAAPKRRKVKNPRKAAPKRRKVKNPRKSAPKRGGRASFIASQQRKGRSAKQAAAAWNLSRAAKRRK